MVATKCDDEERR